MLNSLDAQLGTAIAVVIVAFAFLKSDKPERIGAGTYALGLFASLLVQGNGQLTGPHWGLMLIDAAIVAIYASLAWKSRRAWPVWATALQVLIVMTHLLMIIDRRPPPAAFYTVMNIASSAILAAMAIGVVQAWRDQRTTGLESSNRPKAG